MYKNKIIAIFVGLLIFVMISCGDKGNQNSKATTEEQKDKQSSNTIKEEPLKKINEDKITAGPWFSEEKGTKFGIIFKSNGISSYSHNPDFKSKWSLSNNGTTLTICEGAGMEMNQGYNQKCPAGNPREEEISISFPSDSEMIWNGTHGTLSFSKIFKE